jgi:hypothetical protein
MLVRQVMMEVLEQMELVLVMAEQEIQDQKVILVAQEIQVLLVLLA